MPARKVEHDSGSALRGFFPTEQHIYYSILYFRMSHSLMLWVSAT
jgi:hypothetical protein